VFDSMRTGDIPLSTKEAVASLLCTTKRFISLVFPHVQQQPNHYDCGLFALAYASSVCNNLNPATETMTNIITTAFSEVSKERGIQIFSL